MNEINPRNILIPLLQLPHSLEYITVQFILLVTINGTVIHIFTGTPFTVFTVTASRTHLF